LGGPNEARELARGQVPIEPGDVAAFPEIFNRAALKRGDPPADRGGVPLVEGRAVFGGFRYELAAKVGRNSVTLYTLYKWVIE
jgi:hypothetical protein